ncbi:DNA polymerase [Anopheles sinensis]|uniref:DNA polymerase n=1 Tax=Anopheles sinensis TaxID=74873 RepID=A0A084WAL3_ANOSI|nr:DNA polymerase [Anopheles sinensis]
MRRMKTPNSFDQVSKIGPERFCRFCAMRNDFRGTFGKWENGQAGCEDINWGFALQNPITDTFAIIHTVDLRHFGANRQLTATTTATESFLRAH